MGDLANEARKQSNWLLIPKEDAVVVRYEGFRIVPSKNDPLKNIIQYIVSYEGVKKVWENGSSKIMLFMDPIPEGSWLRISREKWLAKDGREDSSKSSYVIDLLDEKTSAVKKSSRVQAGEPANVKN